MNDMTLTKTDRDFETPSSRALPSDVSILAGGRGRRSPWLDAVLGEIDSLTSFPQNWDSYGADAPRRDLLDGARTLICSLAAGGATMMPSTFPTRSGGVQFEWEKGSQYFEIELVAQSAATYHYSDSQDRRMKSGEIFKEERLDELLEYIYLIEQAAE